MLEFITKPYKAVHNNGKKSTHRSFLQHNVNDLKNVLSATLSVVTIQIAVDDSNKV